MAQDIGTTTDIGIDYTRPDGTMYDITSTGTAPFGIEYRVAVDRVEVAR